MRTSLIGLVLCLTVAGCGGGDENGKQQSDVRAQDALAKSAARSLTAYVESCFADEQDYSVCVGDKALGASDLPLGTGPGQVVVQDATPTTYTIVAHSESGNTFTLKNTDAGFERTCKASTESASCANGTW